MMMNRTVVTLFILGAFGAGPVLAQALPPNSIHYQGVLRDASGAPLDGTYDMDFRFYLFTSGTDYLLRDQHVAFYGNPVTVSNGMFGVALGGGVVSDGPGSGTYNNLSQVFRDHSQVYLEVRIATEVLTPRTRILGAAYAANAAHLNGRGTGWFLNGSDAAQTKTGPLTVNAAGTADYGLTATGHLAAGHFTDAEDSGEAYLGDSNRGIRAYGSEAGGYFLDTNSSGDTYIAFGDRGVDAWGYEVGGYFRDSNSTAEAYVAYGDVGISAAGNEMGGSFDDRDGTGNASVAYGNLGIHAEGSEAGGYFLDTDGTSSAYLGYGFYGVYAAHGGLNGVGGFFENPDYYQSVSLASRDYALDVDGSAQFQGGLTTFGVGGDSAWVQIPAFQSDLGIHAKGNYMAGKFENEEDDSYAYLAHWDHGVEAVGDVSGGRFQAWNATGVAQCGYGDVGIYATGGGMGGWLWDLNSSGWAHVGYSTYKIYGSGSVSFVQNHPTDPDRVIVYAAPEGDEVATYTRGTSRLVDGEARVSLGETFEWVTNPDIGLTAHLTPREEAVPLAVVELTTSELVVRAPEGSPDVVFDYLVYGLRIGFEESSIVQEKNIEAYIPSMADHRDLYAAHPELKRFNALERFAGMREEIGLDPVPDMTASESLRASIEEFVPGVHPLPEAPLPESSNPDGAQAESGFPDDEIHESIPTAGAADAGPGLANWTHSGDTSVRTIRALTWLPSAESLEPGDLVVLDPERPGTLARATVPEDQAMIGVVVEQEAAAPGWRADTFAVDGASNEVPVAHAGVVHCKVDATYGSIRQGDALTSSPTPGHAMFAAAPRSGAILGKALEPLESGTGTIRVLVLLR